MNNSVKTVTNFINTCYRCLGKVEYPFLSDYSYGELFLQTEDGKDFYYVDLTTNKTFEFVCNAIKADTKLNTIDPQQVLILLADKKNEKNLATEYPICPNCGKRQKHFNDNKPGSKRLVMYATWQYFEGLSETDKTLLLNETAKRSI